MAPAANGAGVVVAEALSGASAAITTANIPTKESM
jgi:hypothetical protein